MAGTDYDGALAAVIICVVLATLALHRLVRHSLVVVRHSEVMIKERWGRFASVLTPGWHFVVPFMEATRVINWRYLNAQFDASTAQVVSIKTDRVDMRETLIDLGRQPVITRDSVQLDIDALTYFRISDPVRAVYSVQCLPDAIELLVQSTLRNLVAGLTLDDTFSSREQINAELLAKVQVRAAVTAVGAAPRWTDGCGG
jgi:regulator of protease activity HflC (stomatin/prohibitin superfamily)